jgi:Ca2+-binding EF-hand superfamily protein
MVDLSNLQDRIRTHFYLKGVHPDDWFEDFDKLRSGRVSVEQFRRGFEFMKFELTAAEFNTLVNEYAERGQVSYRRFCHAIEEVFSNRALETDPHGKTVDAKALALRTQNRIPISTDEAFAALIAKLAHQVVTHAYHVRECFMDFDPHNNGRVTQSQFFRALPFTDLSQSEMQLLIARYADPILRDVNYKQLHADLSEYIGSQHIEDPPQRGMRLLPHHLQSIKFKPAISPSDDLLSQFADFVRERRIRVREFFASHDPLNVGVVPPNKFESVLSLSGYPFAKEEMKYLSEKYREVRDRTPYSNYRRFCNAIEGLAEVDVPPALDRSGFEATRTLEDILAHIRYTINRSRINVLPTLQGFDRSKRGFITAPQFHRALSTLQIAVTIPELSVLRKAYGHGEDDVDYFKFVEDVDPAHKQSRRNYLPIGTTTESIIKTFGHTPTGDRFVTQEVADDLIYKSKRGLIKKVDERTQIDSLLSALKRWSIINSVMFHDFLTDFDLHRCGEIPIGQFRSGMSMSTYQLTEDEFDLIVENYRSPTRPDLIRWKQFSDDVLSAVAPKELEKLPTVTPPHPREVVAQTTIVPNVDDTPRKIMKIVELVARFVKTRRISLMEQFKDKDPMNHRRVTSISFAQVIQLLGVHISKDEIDQLCVFYNDPKTNFVEYPLFVEEVNRRVGMIFGDRASSSIVANPIPKYGNEDSPYLVSQRDLVTRVSSWPEILERLQGHVFKRRIRLLEFFAPFDVHHSGEVPIQKFRTVVGQTDLPLTTPDIDVCVRSFTVPNTDDLFDYRSFCTEINAIFGVNELNRSPLHKGKPSCQAMPDPSSTLQALKSNDEQAFAALLNRMRYMVKTRRMNIKEQFMDYDKKPRKSYITKQQFKQSIARLGLTTDPREFDVLCRKYRCTELEDMNYLAFCDDVDPQ